MGLHLPLFLFLALSLHRVLNQNQTVLRCYSCERENDFGCDQEANCFESEKFCVVVATKIFPRFFLVSKQCSVYCPALVVPAPKLPKPFLLEKPQPFIYVRCCKDRLCNMKGPDFPVDEFREQVGRAHTGRCSHAVSTLLTVMWTALAGLGIL